MCRTCKDISTRRRKKGVNAVFTLYIQHPSAEPEVVYTKPSRDDTVIQRVLFPYCIYCPYPFT
jgi:hypothetical protein